MPPKTLSEYKGALDSANRRMQKFRVQTEETTRKAILGTMTVTGGAIVGGLNGMDAGKMPGTDVDYSAALASVFVLVGLFNGAGRYSDELGAVGGGMAAALAAPYVEGMVRAREK